MCIYKAGEDSVSVTFPKVSLLISAISVYGGVGRRWRSRLQSDVEQAEINLAAGTANSQNQNCNLVTALSVAG